MRMALIQSNYSFKKSDKEIKDFLNNLDANLAILRREASSNSNVICDPTQRFPPRRPIRCVKVNNGDIKVTVRNPEAPNHLEVRITHETNACIETHLWGSSHFSGRSIFPHFLEDQLQDMESFAVPINHSFGGARLRETTLVDFHTTLMEAHERTQLHVLLLGDNNFRRIDHPELQVSIVEDHFVELAKRLVFNPKAQLLVLGLMPCREKFKQFWPLFTQVNTFVENLASDKDRFHYCETDFFLANANWRRQYFRDGVHLNHDGDRLLADRVAQAVSRLLPLF